MTCLDEFSDSSNTASVSSDAIDFWWCNLPLLEELIVICEVSSELPTGPLHVEIIVASTATWLSASDETMKVCTNWESVNWCYFTLARS